MGITNLLRSELTDLVFESRNRQYGAYVLRKQYSKRLFFACITGISIVILLTVSPLIVQLLNNSVAEPVFPDYPPTVVDPPPTVHPPETVKPPDQPQQKQPTPKGSSLIGKPTDEPTDPTTPDPFDPSLKTGDPFGIDSLITVEPVEPGPGPATTFVENKEPIRAADVMPEFNGNYKAWLSSHLEYPAFARDMGTQGTVHVEFVVDEEGNVINAKLLHDIGDGCGEAALKAVRSMPKWKPGIKDGKKVKVYCILPVKFSLR